MVANCPSACTATHSRFQGERDTHLDEYTSLPRGAPPRASRDTRALLPKRSLSARVLRPRPEARTARQHPEGVHAASVVPRSPPAVPAERLPPST